MIVNTMYCVIGTCVIVTIRKGITGKICDIPLVPVRTAAQTNEMADAAFDNLHCLAHKKKYL
jgi:hypothetical protein